MRLLVVTQCFYPDIYAVNDIVKKLVERGHKVTVLTGLPDYTTSKIPKEYKWFRNRHQWYQGAEVFRVSTIARHHGALFRCLNYFSFVISGSIFACLKRWQPFDAIYVWEVSPITMAVPAIVLKHRYHKPLFLYCMDLWPESIKAMGFEENSLFYKMVHRLSKWIYSQCDHIAVSSKPFFGYLEQVIGYSRNQMSYLPQYGSEELLCQNLDKATQKHTDFLFVGNIGKVQDVDVIIRAAAQLPESLDYTIHIVGGGSEYENCKALTQRLGLEKIIKFYGPCLPEETPKFYRQADACLLTLNGDNMIGFTLPGKLQTYMAAGKPVLAAINGAGRETIEESRCGAAVPAGDVQGLRDIMQNFIDHRKQYRDCGKNGQTYFEEQFCQEKHFDILERLLNKSDSVEVKL